MHHSHPDRHRGCWVRHDELGYGQDDKQDDVRCVHGTGQRSHHDSWPSTTPFSSVQLFYCREISAKKGNKMCEG